MKKTIKLAVVAALALGATSALATNGSNLIGIGAKSRAMGGTSIGISHGAESGLSNAALITSVKGTEISFGGTIFMPDVTTTNAYTGLATTTNKSTADMNVIPAVSIATKVSDNLYVGLGMWGTAGMGVDYRDTAGTGTQFEMVTNLQLMQFGVPVAYKSGAFSVGITPVLQYGSLDINFDTNGSNPIGEGVAQDLQFGYNLGAAYEVSGLTIGLSYKSQIDMDYQNVLPTAGSAFGLILGKELSTPEEIGFGASYSTSGHTLAVDYKNIKWSDAKGYKDFGWKDQDVYALGYSFTTDKWVARLGYNYAKSPIVSLGTAHPYSTKNTLNLLGFPGIVESHYTFGGSYSFTERVSVDLAYVLASEVTQSIKNNSTGSTTDNITTKHSQSGVSFGLNYNF